MSSIPNNALEAALGRAAERPRFLADGSAMPDPARMVANFAGIEAELDAPPLSRLARVLGRVGVDERTIPLITATPSLRRSWLISIVIAVLFAINAASTSNADGVDRIVVFLTMAPLVPLLGVALAFGPTVDPTHEIAVAAPLDGFRLFLVRSITVLSTSTTVLLIGSILMPEGGGYRVAWLLPALAVTTVTMAAATRFSARRAAAVVGVAWLLLVMIIAGAADTAAAFGPSVQIVSLVISVAGLVTFTRRRQRLDALSIR
jgi:hypothetical protein